MGRFVRGALIGFLFVLTVGVWPAGANVSNVQVTYPSSTNQVISGSYDSSGSPVGFTKTIKATATTNCNGGFSSVRFTVSGPSSYVKTFSPSPPSNNGTYNFSASWDTQDLPNGVYDVRIDVSEPPDGLLNSCGQSGNYHRAAKLANPPAAPTWVGSPAPASDGSANVQLQWKKNSETDVVEYQISRSGPDGTKTAAVPASSACSGSTCTSTDPASNFPSSYDGSYSYSIKALRSRPDYNSSEDPQPMCQTTNSQPCVSSSGSDVRQVTLTAPTPSPSPSPGGSPTGGSTGGLNSTSSSGGSSGAGGAAKKTSVLSFGGTGSGSHFNEFYTGTYSENLPYQPKTLIVGDGTATPDSSQVEAAALSSEAPNYRTIMLPVAGGLLAFLSAAHVRRLLVHF